MDYDLIIDAIDAGNSTTNAIAAYVDAHGGPSNYGHIARVLREMRDDGRVERDESSKPYTYFVVGDDGAGDDAADSAGAEPDDDASDDADGDTLTWKSYLDHPLSSPDDGAGGVAAQAAGSGDGSDDAGVYVPDVPDDAPQDVDPDGVIVSRSYDWDAHVRRNATEYVAQDGELGFVDAKIDRNAEPPHAVLVSGPTGCGKTTLGENLSGRRGAPMIEVQCYEGMHEGDLIGRLQPHGDDWQWVDGPLTKALLASREREVIVLLDEINRARGKGKSVLFSALDHRANVKIPQLDQVVRGNPENLIVVATANFGRGYQVNPMDLAERNRFGSWIDLGHLGEDRPEAEARLVARRAPVSTRQAEAMVDAANDVRGLADDGDIPIGPPTRSLLNWASDAAAYADTDHPNPWMEAATSAVIEPLYGGQQRDENAVDRAEATIEATFNEAPFDADAFDAYIDGDE